MQKKPLLRKNSILVKMLMPMLVIVILQASLIFGAVSFAGVFKDLKTSAIDVMSDKTLTRKEYIQDEFVDSWMNINDSYKVINKKIMDTAASKNYSMSEFLKDDTAVIESINSLQNKFYTMLRVNSVNGVFVVLNRDSEKKLGLYIRDDDPTSNSENYSDLSIEIAPLEFNNIYTLPRSSFSKTMFDFSESGRMSSKNFFTYPQDAAKEHKDMSFENLGYWHPPYILNNSSLPIISYTLPLLDESGAPYGVLGVEVSTSYIKSLLPFSEINATNKGSYILGKSSRSKTDIDNDEIDQNNIFSGFSGAEYIKGMTPSDIKVTKTDDKKIVKLTVNNKKTYHLYAFAEPIKLYNNNTPFENENWRLISVIEKDILFALPNDIYIIIVLAVTIATALAFFMILMTSYVFAKPIIALTKQVKRQSSGNTLSKLPLKKTKISEIDDLTSAIEELNEELLAAAGKLSTIISIADIKIAAYEYDSVKNTAFYTDNIFALLEYQKPSVVIDAAKLVELLGSLDGYLISSETEIKLYKFTSLSGEDKWIQLKEKKNGTNNIGVFIDVTKENIEKNKIEYDRDYDLLTNIYNRRAFQTNFSTIFSASEFSIAAFVMMDLDNLKFINDTYGHDYGDLFIKATADCLKETCANNSHTLIGRMSGDEFYVFIFGYDNETDIKNKIIEIKTKLYLNTITLPDKTKFKLRASAGVSWYPKDTRNKDELIKFADYAMYEIKNSVKGEFHDYNKESYKRDSYLFANKEELNKLIDEELVQYYFEPIVDITTGEAFAYEALMRPQLSSFKNPLEVLAVARAQHKLSQIEKLTFFKAMDTYVALNEYFGEKKIFINSISNQILSDADAIEFEKKFHPYLTKLVVEFTEEEKASAALTKKKLKYIKKWRGQTAIDDFGVGYNGESMLLKLLPHYVKLDKSMIRNINSDTNRKSMVENLIAYTKQRSILIIAEGVETIEEAETLIKLGVNYIQGYLISRAEPLPKAVDFKMKQAIVSLYEQYQKKNN